MNAFYLHKSRPVVFEAQQAHKNTLRKHRSAWYRVLNEESDSDDDLAGLTAEADGVNELAAEIRNLNFEIDTDHYFRELRRGVGQTGARAYKPARKLGITRKERDQLKTSYLRKTMTQMMTLQPQNASIWKDELFDDKQVQHTLALLESRAKDPPI